MPLIDFRKYAKIPGFQVGLKTYRLLFHLKVTSVIVIKNKILRLGKEVFSDLRRALVKD